MPRKKVRKKASECKCGGRYVVDYEDNIPIFVCNKCDDRDDTWKRFFVEYLDLHKTKDNWLQDRHKVSCVIGFFCYMYQKHYDTDYIFVPQSINPFSSKECRDANILIKSFGGNAMEARRYITWFFKEAIKPGTEISSLGYLTTAGIIRKYILHRKRNSVIKRSTTLSDDFISWCKSNVPDIFDRYSLETVSDLGAILNFYKAEGSDENMVEEQALIEYAEKMHIIKDGKINVGAKK